MTVYYSIQKRVSLGLILSQLNPVHNVISLLFNIHFTAMFPSVHREIGIDGAKRIRLAQVRIQWRAFVNTVMTIRVP
jgi:hypothetical protein